MIYVLSEDLNSYSFSFLNSGSEPKKTLSIVPTPPPSFSVALSEKNTQKYCKLGVERVEGLSNTDTHSDKSCSLLTRTILRLFCG